MPPEGHAEETLATEQGQHEEGGAPTQLNTTVNDTAEGGTERPASQLPSYWHLREAMAGVDVPSSAERDGESTLGEPQEPLSAEPGTQELEDALEAHNQPTTPSAVYSGERRREPLSPRSRRSFYPSLESTSSE